MADTPNEPSAPKAAKEPKSPYVKITEAIGGSAVGIFFIACFFGGEKIGWPAAAATVALVVLGLGLAYFAHKPQ